MKWRDFLYQGKTYSLSHLDSKSAMIAGFKFNIEYSSHCFTKYPESMDEFDDPELFYTTPKEKDRVFCFERYDFSKQLPEIIQKLAEKDCWHTHKGNFFTIEIQDKNSVISEYEIFFQIYRSGNGWLTLQIQSGYIRKENHKSKQPVKRKIKFSVIAKNILEGKKLRPPPKR